MQLFTSYCTSEIDRILESIKTLTARGCDGVLISGSFLEKDCQAFNALSIPLVILDTLELPELPPRMIHYNYRHGVNEAITALQAAGHREFCYFGDPNIVFDPRRLTFLDAMSEDLFIDCRAVTSPDQIQSFLDLHPGCRAALCINDLVALQLIGTLNKLGLSVPDDFSVVGFDDIKAAAYTLPPLCSISRPLTEAVHAAMGMLRKQIEDTALSPQNYPPIEFLCNYIPRGSIGPNPGRTE